MSAPSPTGPLLLPSDPASVARNGRRRTLKLLLQHPFSPTALNGTKLLALLPAAAAWLLPALSAALIWRLFGGAIHFPELLTLFLGHLLYALVIACVALFATAVSGSLAAAAMICLGVTLGNWVLDFAASGNDILAGLSRISLTAPLRHLESGLLASTDIILFIAWSLLFFLAASALLHPGRPLRQRAVRLLLVAATVPTLGWIAMQHPLYLDATENRRHSFNPAEEQALSQLDGTLKITIHMARDDSRVQDLEQKVLGRLRRTVPHLEIVWADTSGSLFSAPESDNYGLIEYDYKGRHDQSYSTSEHEILPIIHALAGQKVTPEPVPPYSGHPLVADPGPARGWFYLALPALYLVLGCWLRCSTPSQTGGNRR